ncbi:hypothetical protein [Saccharopolyspora pogona]|uniref:hypothetical protein n=1 Tax=Saccharopolyspora pogona TaxID=333966 RepID=UPI001688736A|nr:hypothetical protein [Saccharopolyspora pogona]
MADGFHVDLKALAQAGDGVNQTLSQLARHRVDTIDDDGAIVWHDRLAGTITDFCDRWQIGVNLAKDGQAIAGQLAHCVETYQKVDLDAQEQLAGIVERPTGPDPAGPR